MGVVSRLTLLAQQPIPSANMKLSMATIALNTADRAIINALREGRNVPANLAKDTEYSRQYVYDRLKRLREHGVVANIGNGVYELVENEVPAEAEA